MEGKDQLPSFPATFAFPDNSKTYFCWSAVLFFQPQVWAGLDMNLQPSAPFQITDHQASDISPIIIVKRITLKKIDQPVKQFYCCKLHLPWQL